MDEVKSAQGSEGKNGTCVSAPLCSAPESIRGELGFASGKCTLYPALSIDHTLGKNPSPVNAADSLSSTLLPNRSRHLRTTLLAHQKLATLSSNRPRSNGKILVMGSIIDLTEGAKGGRQKGRKRKRKLETVVTPRCIKRLRLQDRHKSSKWRNRQKRTQGLVHQETNILPANKNRQQEHNTMPFV